MSARAPLTQDLATASTPVGDGKIAFSVPLFDGLAHLLGRTVQLASDHHNGHIIEKEFNDLRLKPVCFPGSSFTFLG